MVIEELYTKLGFKVDPEGIEKGKKALTGFKTFIGGLALGAGFVSLAKTGLEAAMTMEGLSAQFKVMTGSAEGAAKIIQEISEFAAKTPFDKLGLSGAAKTLMSFGLEADKVVPTLRMLGDVAGSDQNKLNSLALVFGQIQSTGKLMGQDLLQLINQGFNPLTVISQKTGMSMSDLKDAMAKGAISADMVTMAFQAATSEGGLFFGNLEAQSQTLQGQISTLKDNFVTALQNMAEAFLPMLKAGTAALIAFDWTPIVQTVQRFGQVLSSIDFETAVTWLRRISELIILIATRDLQATLIGALKKAGMAATATFQSMSVGAATFGATVKTMSIGVATSMKVIGKAALTSMGPIIAATSALEILIAAGKLYAQKREEWAFEEKWQEREGAQNRMLDAWKAYKASPSDINARRDLEGAVQSYRSKYGSNAAVPSYIREALGEKDIMEAELKAAKAASKTPSMKTGDLDKAFASLTAELQASTKETKKNTKAVKDNTEAKREEPNIADLARQAFDANFNIKLKSLMVGSV